MEVFSQMRAFTAIGVVVVSLAACGTSDTNTRSTTTTTPPSTTSPSSTTSTTEYGKTDPTVTTSSSTTTAIDDPPAVLDVFAAGEAELDGAAMIGCTPLDQTPEAIEIWPPYEVGQPRDLVVVIKRVGRGTLTEDIFSTTPVVLTPIEQLSDGGHVFDWLAEATSLDNVGLGSFGAMIADDMLEDLPREHIVYEVDGFGYMGPVHNVEDLRSGLAAVIELLDRFIESDDESIAADALAQASDDRLVAMMTQRIQAFHLLDGSLLDPDEWSEVEAELPTAFSAEPLDALLRLSVLDDEDADGCLLVEHSLLPEPASLVEFIFDLMTGFSGEEPSAQDLAELSDFAEAARVEIVTTFQVDPTSGFIRRVQVRNTTQLGDELHEKITIVVDVTASND
ncbi:MAG: hypothetical protein GY708_25135 [Actinomycetia bacterium]|nr:hypothetical protein [Actinomycetes bacterium]